MFIHQDFNTFGWVDLSMPAKDNEVDSCLLLYQWLVEELSSSGNEKVINVTAGEENTYYLKGPSWKWVEADDFIINNCLDNSCHTKWEKWYSVG